jgi:hypothetical protein
MQEFDTLIAVDWSAASVPVKGENSIWISRRAKGEEHVLLNFATRFETEAYLAQQIAESQARGTRLLMGFDFPFGYPDGFVAALGEGGSQPPWRVIWETFTALVEDDARNRNNRFAVATKLNQRMGFAEGPFWGCPAKQAGPSLSPYRPKQHFLAEKRLCEVPVPKSQPGWKLAYVGSVGSQGLMGIPVLERLRAAHGVQVWPFDPLPADGPVQVFTELYLSLWPVGDYGGPCKDADQVQAMTDRWISNQAAILRWMTACYPNVVYAEEGWVLGVEPPA